MDRPFLPAATGDFSGQSLSQKVKDILQIGARNTNSLACSVSTSTLRQSFIPLTSRASDSQLDQTGANTRDYLRPFIGGRSSESQTSRQNSQNSQLDDHSRAYSPAGLVNPTSSGRQSPYGAPSRVGSLSAPSNTFRSSLKDDIHRGTDSRQPSVLESKGRSESLSRAKSLTAAPSERESLQQSLPTDRFYRSDSLTIAYSKLAAVGFSPSSSREKTTDTAVILDSVVQTEFFNTGNVSTTARSEVYVSVNSSSGSEHNPRSAGHLYVPLVRSVSSSLAKLSSSRLGRSFSTSSSQDPAGIGQKCGGIPTRGVGLAMESICLSQKNNESLLPEGKNILLEGKQQGERPQLAMRSELYERQQLDERSQMDERSQLYQRQQPGERPQMDERSQLYQRKQLDEMAGVEEPRERPQMEERPQLYHSQQLDERPQMEGRPQHYQRQQLDERARVEETRERPHFQRQPLEERPHMEERPQFYGRQQLDEMPPMEERSQLYQSQQLDEGPPIEGRPQLYQRQQLGERPQMEERPLFFQRQQLDGLKLKLHETGLQMDERQRMDRWQQLGESHMVGKQLEKSLHLEESNGDLRMQQLDGRQQLGWGEQLEGRQYLGDRQLLHGVLEMERRQIPEGMRQLDGKQYQEQQFDGLQQHLDIRQQLLGSQKFDGKQPDMRLPLERSHENLVLGTGQQQLGVTKQPEWQHATQQLYKNPFGLDEMRQGRVEDKLEEHTYLGLRQQQEYTTRQQREGNHPDAKKQSVFRSQPCQKKRIDVSSLLRARKQALEKQKENVGMRTNAVVRANKAKNMR
jgi:hypothetical protein